jgi:hypothetical protein
LPLEPLSPPIGGGDEDSSLDVCDEPVPLEDDDDAPEALSDDEPGELEDDDEDSGITAAEAMSAEEEGEEDVPPPLPLPLLLASGEAGEEDDEAPPLASGVGEDDPPSGPAGDADDAEDDEGEEDDSAPGIAADAPPLPAAASAAVGSGISPPDRLHSLAAAGLPPAALDSGPKLLTSRFSMKSGSSTTQLGACRSIAFHSTVSSTTLTPTAATETGAATA